MKNTDHRLSKKKLIDEVIILLQNDQEKWGIVSFMDNEAIGHKELDIDLIHTNNFFKIRLRYPFQLKPSLFQRHRLYKVCKELKYKKLYDIILNEHTLKEKESEDIK